MPFQKGGPKRGGRAKGVKNKKTKQAEQLEKAAAEGILPLDFMLDAMRDEARDFVLRADMAKSAAPYLHPRRAPEDAKGNTVPPMIYMHPNLEDE